VVPIVFATAHYGISKPVATSLVVVVGAGALAGVYFGGRLADRLLQKGYIRARIVLPIICLLLIPAFLGPAVLTTSLALALPLLTLWGRAEGVRTALRTLGEAAAPVLFGFVSQYIFGGPASSGLSGAGSSGGKALTPAAATGLEHTFLLFLATLGAAGLLAVFALRTYPRDLATAAASAEAIARKRQRQPKQPAPNAAGSGRQPT
jgi:predicted MFS family arabinose efflux permease